MEIGQVLKVVLEGLGFEIESLGEWDGNDKAGESLDGYTVGWKAQGRKSGYAIEVVVAGYGLERSQELDYRKLPGMGMGMMRNGVDMDWTKVTKGGFYGIVCAWGKGGRLIQVVNGDVVRRISKAIEGR